MRRRFRLTAGLILLCPGLHSQIANPPLPTGTVIPSLACSANPKQSYALYLPSSFAAGRRWPILYMFDPGARGQVAVEAARAAAEKFGYIVVASNNSRNGPMGGTEEAAEAVWQDTQQRFPVDERRRYAAGMSGGARAATGMALGCGECFAGVVANAAGFPGQAGPGREMKFAYFAAVGDADFNYPEFVGLRKKLEAAGARYRIRVFAGEHGWAPAEVWMEALEWMDVQAMKSGTLARDERRIGESLDADMGRARELRAKGDLLEAAREYSAVVRGFDGLADVGAARSALAELQLDKRLKKAEKDEADAVSQQAQLTDEASRQMQAISRRGLSAADFSDLRGTIADLKKKADRAGNSHESRALVIRRVLGELVVQAFESGQFGMEQKRYDDALQYFDLAAAGARHPEWSHYQRARAFAMKADKKGVISELRLAVNGGLRDASALEAEEFRAYRELPQFQELVTELKAKSAAAAP